jgi:hypothetical protein
MSALSDWATVASAVFAAGASAAAWQTVREARRAAETAVTPELAVSLHRGPDDRLDVLVHNVGPGVARDVQVMLAAKGTRLDSGTRAVLSADTGFRIGTTIALAEDDRPDDPSDDHWPVVVSCRDVRQRMWAWNPSGVRHEVPIKRGPVTGASVFAMFGRGPSFADFRRRNSRTASGL